MNEHAERRDTADAQRGLIRPTVGEPLRRWVGEPALGFVVAVYAIAAVVSVHDSRLQTLGLLAVGFTCLAVLRTSSLHRAAWGAAAIFLVTVGAAVVTLVAR